MTWDSVLLYRAQGVHAELCSLVGLTALPWGQCLLRLCNTKMCTHLPPWETSPWQWGRGAEAGTQGGRPNITGFKCTEEGERR